jgi:hypothetical protein
MLFSEADQVRNLWHSDCGVMYDSMPAPRSGVIRGKDGFLEYNYCKYIGRYLLRYVLPTI